MGNIDGRYVGLVGKQAVKHPRLPGNPMPKGDLLPKGDLER